MRDKLRVGVVGCGAQAQLAYIPALKANPNVELAALCDSDVRKVNQLCQMHGVTRHFADFDGLKEADDIDAVLITTPNHLHAPMTLAALHTGKDVLCEMPLGLNAAEVEQMVETARREGRSLMPCLAARLRPDVQTIRRFIDGGELGALYYAKTGWLQGRESWSLPGWRGQRLRAGGGAFMSLGTALLDAALYLLSGYRPVSVVAAAHHRDPRAEVEDTAFAMIRFEPELFLTVEVGWSVLQEKDFTYLNLMGNGGAALLNPVQIHKEMHGHLVNVTPQISAKGIQRAANQALVKVWVESLLHGSTPIVTAEDGLVISKLADAFYQSQKTRCEVRPG
ncbi:Gfo/Idh/MocA family oxidoreductase [candidate division WOR-3 bacterium]|nr:Gfo/Idh/MocA family oxidoreductase [candidate division WOR-3 bacterium]